jgi:hypothetical protein
MFGAITQGDIDAVFEVVGTKANARQMVTFADIPGAVGRELEASQYHQLLDPIYQIGEGTAAPPACDKRR